MVKVDWEGEWYTAFVKSYNRGCHFLVYESDGSTETVDLDSVRSRGHFCRLSQPSPFLTTLHTSGRH